VQTVTHDTSYFIDTCLKGIVLKYATFQKIFLTFLFIFQTMFFGAPAPSLITYECPTGRLGDQIIAYVKAKWLSHKYKITFLYQPFPGSEKLKLHFEERLSVEKNLPSNAERVLVTSSTPLNRTMARPTAYIVKLSTQKDELGDGDTPFLCKVHDPTFKKIISKMLAPAIAVKKISLPKNRISVAVHVRKGSGPDNPVSSRQLYNSRAYSTKPIRIIDKTDLNNLCVDERWPNKFPPDQFYIDQIRLFSQLVDNAPLYVYLFTDYKDPAAVARTYAREINNPNIIFDYHSPVQIKEMGVMDDYYNMAQFDCLIRPGSNFSRAIQLFGDHPVVISARNSQWRGDAVVVENVEISTYNSNSQSYSFFNRSVHERNYSDELKNVLKNILFKRKSL
jgi:hypothetical protein